MGSLISGFCLSTPWRLKKKQYSMVEKIHYKTLANKVLLKPIKLTLIWSFKCLVEQNPCEARWHYTTNPPHTQMQSTPLFINLLSEALPNITISKAYTCGSMFKYTPSQSSYSRQVLPALEACTLVTIFFKYFHL